MGIAAISLSTGNHEWYTPPEILESARKVLGVIDLDPASSELANEFVRAKKYYSVKENGLKQDWFGRVWLNPPFNAGLIDAFADKLLRSVKVESAIMLTDNATDAKWFRRMVEGCAGLIFTTSRLNFINSAKLVRGEKTARGRHLRGSAFFYIGTEVENFHAEFCQYGWQCK